MSWAVISRSSRRIWMGWRVVATTVWRSIRPASRSSPYSRSEKPPPLPRRAPSRFTATEPVSTRSSSGTSSRSITRAVAQRALDGGRLALLLVGQPARLQQPEGVLLAQARDRHHERLALRQRQPPHVGLRRVGVGLDRLGVGPGGMAREPLGGLLGPGEVGDPPVGAGEAGDPLAVHRAPHVAPHLVLGPHRADRTARLARPA